MCRDIRLGLCMLCLCYSYALFACCLALLSLHLTFLRVYIQAKFGCSTFIVFRRWGERPNERVITAGIGWFLLASATKGVSGYIKLAYCFSAKGLQ